MSCKKHYEPGVCSLLSWTNKMIPSIALSCLSVLRRTADEILSEQDESLVLESLAYIKRCDSVVPTLKGDLERLLASSHPQIRLEAANLVQSTAKAP